MAHPQGLDRRYGSRLGPLLADWRKRRRLSQLQLASNSGVSSRHLSFVETGRSRPSRELLLHLAEHLDVPLRDRNGLLLAAGYAPTYPETPVDGPEMDRVRGALDLLLSSHEPYPALVVNRRFELVAANRSVTILTEGIAPELLVPPVNIMRAALHPDGLARRVVNLADYRRHLLLTLERVATSAGDDHLLALHRELVAYPAPEEANDDRSGAPGGGSDVVLPIRLRPLRPGDPELALFSIIATFGAPRDVTVSELAIESFFPADHTTEAVLRGRDFDPAGYLRRCVEDRWNDGDVTGFMEAFADDAELWPQATFPDGGPVIRTKAEIERFFRRIHRPVELGRLERVGDEVLGSFRWTGDAPDAGYDWALLYRFDGPRIVRARYYADAGHARRAADDR